MVPDLCRKIRAAKRHPYTYIIMVTGRTDRLDRLQGLAAGADDFLTKPVDEEELVVRLAIAGRILGVQAELEAKNSRLEEMAKLDPLDRAGQSSTAGRGHRRRGCRRRVWLLRFRCWQSTSTISSHTTTNLAIWPATRCSEDRSHAEGQHALGRPGGSVRRRRIHRAASRGGCRDGGEHRRIVRAAIESADWPYRRVTASFGIATAMNVIELTDIAGLLHAADGALYQSKNSGAIA